MEAAELSTWFKASCHSPEPLELPEPLYRALMQAIALRQLDPEWRGLGHRRPSGSRRVEGFAPHELVELVARFGRLQRRRTGQDRWRRLSVLFRGELGPVNAVDAGARVIVVNDARTEMDELAHLLLRGNASEILPRIVGELPATIRLQ